MLGECVEGDSLSRREHPPCNQGRGAVWRLTATSRGERTCPWCFSKGKDVPRLGPGPEDTTDPLYKTTRARGELTKLLDQALSTTDADRIKGGTPSVDVTVWSDRAEVLVLSE